MGLFVFVLVLLVLTFAYLLDRFSKEKKKQNAIVAVRNCVEKMKVAGEPKSFREKEQLSIPEESLPQENEGDNPHDKDFPVIRFHSYGEKGDLVSATEGIRWLG